MSDEESPKPSVWLEWYVVLGSEPKNKIQINFILDFIKPCIEKLGDKIELFHFLRYFQEKSHVENTWNQWIDFAEVDQFLQGAASVNYVTFRVLVRPEKVEKIRDKISSDLKSFHPEVFAVYGKEEDADVKKGLETYGGDAIHPVQHEFFHQISIISLQLLEKSTNNELDLKGNTCGIEDVAGQWSHMVLNQLGVYECGLSGIQLQNGQSVPAFFYNLICSDRT